MKVPPKFGVVIVAAISHQFRGDCHTTFLSVWLPNEVRFNAFVHKVTGEARSELVTEGVELSTGEAGMLFFADDMVVMAQSEEELQSNTAQLQKKVIIHISTTCFTKAQHMHKAIMFCQKTIWSVVCSKEHSETFDLCRM